MYYTIQYNNSLDSRESLQVLRLQSTQMACFLAKIHHLKSSELEKTSKSITSKAVNLQHLLPTTNGGIDMSQVWRINNMIIAIISPKPGLAINPGAQVALGHLKETVRLPEW